MIKLGTGLISSSSYCNTLYSAKIIRGKLKIFSFEKPTAPSENQQLLLRDIIPMHLDYFSNYPYLIEPLRTYRKMCFHLKGRNQNYELRRTRKPKTHHYLCFITVPGQWLLFRVLTITSPQPPPPPPILR